MIELVLIGSGNVATQLFRAFKQSEEIKVIQVLGRNTRQLKLFEKYTETGSISQARMDADIYIVAVSDDAVSTVYQELKSINGLIVHTSGSMPLRVHPKRKRQGVFYPLQTFSSNKAIGLKEVPVCIEAMTPADLGILQSVARAVSNRVVPLNTDKRRQLHLAAVFANNFTNYLYLVANELLQEEKLPFNLLLPLIRETAGKIGKLSPYEAQTGPARRQDTGTLRKHQQLLKDPVHKEIYSLFSNSIMETYAKKL